jgi:hypothetical protein
MKIDIAAAIDFFAEKTFELIFTPNRQGFSLTYRITVSLRQRVLLGSLTMQKMGFNVTHSVAKAKGE